MTPMPAPETTDADELDLSHYLDVLLRRRWIVASAALIVFVSTALVTFTMRPVYQAGAMLIIEKERSGETAAPAGSFIVNSDDDYYQTQYKLLQSETLLRRVYTELNLAQTEDFKGPHGFENFQKAISISPVLRSRLVYVRAQSHDAALAAAAANRLSADFVDENLENQLFISKEVLHALQSDGAGSGSAADSLPAVVDNKLIQTLKGEYADLQAKHAELSQRYTARYPMIVQITSQMNALRDQIQTETARVVSSMKTELSGQLKGNNVRVIDPADVPQKPVRPRKLLNLALGLLGGLGLGTALAFLIETIDQSVRTQADVEERLGLPFLGILPQTVIGETPYAPLLARESSLTAEAFRNLRTMVDFAGVDGAAKSLLVTSTMQGEGKSYAAANLAVALSQLGESVLLIDGDLRRPSLHRTFRLPPEHGLSQFLAGGKDPAELASLVLETDAPGLKVLPCGPRAPNPSELLNTPRLLALLSWAKASFDRVVVDCTPMFPINDTLLWGRHVKSAVFVARYGRTRAPLIADAARKLAGGGVKVLGVVVNAATPGGLSYASYGYHYQQYYHAYAQDSGPAQAA